ncbi:MAG: Ppx/GppA family phosphatase [Verrucomicrobia bacterium]|nr:Ppx/GppA family phosphatase [Verrucomicrobiota bacterium]
MPRRAVIDIGSNSVKLLVAEVVEGEVRPLIESSEQTRLGRGFYSTRRLSATAVSLTAAAVGRFVREARVAGAEGIRVLATSAVRDAHNPESLTDAVQRLAGLPVEVITGDQEADWAFQGVISDRRLAKASLLILDVGGGSTEFSLGCGPTQTFRESFPLGSVRLLDRLAPGDPPTPAELEACREVVRDFLAEQVAPVIAAALQIGGAGRPQLVGTGGTASILGAMEQGLAAFDRDRIEAARLARRWVEHWVAELWGRSLAQRQQLPGLPANRADVILFGAAIYEAVMRQFDCPTLRVSTRGLRFGALLDESAGAWGQADLTSPRASWAGAAAGSSAEARARQEVLAVMNRFESEPAHARHVAALAGELFGALQPLHGLGGRERLWLEAAAYLHDIGWTVARDGRQHHKHSARLILEQRWEHLEARPVDLIAQVARYHRKSLPVLRHKRFAALTAADRSLVRTLAALLRIADGLDRSHRQRVRSVGATLTTGAVVLHLSATGAIAQEIAGALKKADLAQKVFRRPVRVELA